MRGGHKIKMGKLGNVWMEKLLWKKNNKNCLFIKTLCKIYIS